jgi:hypothetical protein
MRQADDITMKCRGSAEMPGALPMIDLPHWRSHEEPCSHFTIGRAAVVSLGQANWRAWPATPQLLQIVGASAAM